ncbi:T9SS type A sorting domain-containing protein [Flavobacterium sp. LaA7.5]|nr:T9SS type A sorting domain-containing protein [Flavobacterium salilacus subsp. altitudinum]
MRKIMLFLATSVVAVITANAQNYYFAASQQNYSDLENPTSINNGEVWDYNIFNEVEIPFDFSVNGEIVSRFLFDDDFFVLLTPEADYFESEEGVYYISTSSIYMQDRTYSSGVSSSPISYTISGAEGNRILKLEIKNAGLELADDNGLDEDEYYLSYQVWLYEADNAIEFRYGDHNITNIEIATDGEPLFAGFGNPYSVNIVYGNIFTPQYGEFTEDTLPLGTTLSEYPSNGTVYRFAPAEVAGIPVVQKQTVSLYPNPATHTLTIKSDSYTEGVYTVTDITGKIIMQNSISSGNTQVNVESLTSGMYFLNINDNHIKFLKK